MRGHEQEGKIVKSLLSKAALAWLFIFGGQ